MSEKKIKTKPAETPMNTSRGKDLQQLISRKPDFLVRWSLLIFAIVVAGLTCSAFFIRSPDIIHAKARLVTIDDHTKCNVTMADSVRNGYYAEVFIPQFNFGKVRTGQTIWLQFDAYPYQEFGQVKGKLETLCPSGTDSGFLGWVKLPTPLLTNHNKRLPSQPGLTAEAQIVVKDMLLAEKIYSIAIAAIPHGKK